MKILRRGNRNARTGKPPDGTRNPGRNIERDKKVKLELKKLEWKISIVCDCELKDKTKLESKLKRFLSK